MARSATQLLLLSGWLVLVIACESKRQAASDKPQASEQPGGSASISVTVEIDFAGRQVTKSTSVALPADSTVLDGLLELRRQGELSFVFRGYGETAFVTSIDGLENGGASGDNWIYRINGQLGKVSCGVAHLNDDDRLSWRYGPYDR